MLNFDEFYIWRFNQFKGNASVTKLDLSGNEIGAYGVKHLAALFEENSNITELV